MRRADREKRRAARLRELVTNRLSGSGVFDCAHCGERRYTTVGPPASTSCARCGRIIFVK